MTTILATLTSAVCLLASTQQSNAEQRTTANNSPIILACHQLSSGTALQTSACDPLQAQAYAGPIQAGNYTLIGVTFLPVSKKCETSMQTHQAKGRLEVAVNQGVATIKRTTEFTKPKTQTIRDTLKLTPIGNGQATYQTQCGSSSPTTTNKYSSWTSGKTKQTFLVLYGVLDGVPVAYRYVKSST